MVGKRIVVVLLVICFGLTTLVACKSENSNRPVTDGTTGKTVDANQTNTKTELEEFEKIATIEKAVLYDAAGVVITANELKYSTFYASLVVTIENNSDKDLTLTCGSMAYCINSINGYMVEQGYMHCEVEKGKVQTEEIKFDFKSLNAYGITRIADIEVGFQISDDSYNYVYTGPLQVQTSIYDSYSYDTNNYRKIIENGAFAYEFNCTINMLSVNELYNRYGISIASVAVATNMDGDPIMLLEIQNMSSDSVCVSTSKVYINDKLAYDNLWSSDVINSKKTLVKSISLSDLAEEYEGSPEDVAAISKIAFTFSVGENWYNIADSKEVSILIPEIFIPMETE